VTFPHTDRLPLAAIGAAIFRPSGLLLSIRQVFSTSILVFVLSVGTGVIMARGLGPTGRGELSAMMLWPALAAGLFTLGLRPALTYTLAAQRGEPRCLILVALLLTFCTGLVAAGFGALVVPIWLEGYSPDVITFAQWAMLIAPVTLLLRSAKGILQARGEFGLYNRNHYVPPLISLVVLAALAFSGSLNPFTGAVAVLSPPLPVLVANLVWIARIERPRFCQPAHSIRELLSYGLRSWGKDVVGTLATEVDRAVLIGLVSPAALGLYVVAKHLARPTEALSSAIVTVLFPQASRVKTKDAVRLLARAARVSTAVSCALVLPLALAAPPLLELLYGEAFVAAVDPFRILLIDAVLIGFSSILMQAFMSSGRPGVVTALLVVGLLVNVLGMLLLVPAFGLTGAAFAVLISTIVRLAFLLLCFPLVLQVSPPSPLLRGKDVAWLWRGRQEAGG
jgi:O-antigen/teichoic acid export membrane protein